MSFFQRLGESLRRFMAGRYGTDLLNRHLIFLWFCLAIANLLFHSLILYLLELLLSFVVFWRMLSRNFVKRQKENAAYYEWTKKVSFFFRHLSVRFRERKTSRFFRCPSCSAPIKMPRKIGKFQIRCQKCGHSFIKEFKK